MKTYINIIIIICCFSLFSCSNEIKKEKKSDILIDFSAKKDILSISKISDSISYINFKTPKSILIGNVSGIKYSNSKYYIYDRATYSILIFNNEGNFINKISNQGKGPNEYTSIMGFDVNPVNGTINIYDGAIKQMLVFDIKGQLIRKFNVKDIVRDFAILTNGDYLFYTPDFMKGARRGLWRVDSNGKFKENLITLNENFLYGMAVPTGYFCRINKDVIGLIGNEDKNEVYNITNNKIKVICSYNVSIKIPKEMRTKESSQINKAKYAGKFYIKPMYLESERWLLTVFTNFKRGVISLFDKKTKKQYNVADFKNDIDGLKGMPMGNISINNSIVSIIPNKTLLSIDSDTLKRIGLKLEANSNNTVVQFIHLKK